MCPSYLTGSRTSWMMPYYFVPESCRRCVLSGTGRWLDNCQRRTPRLVQNVLTCMLFGDIFEGSDLWAVPIASVPCNESPALKLRGPETETVLQSASALASRSARPMSKPSQKSSADSCTMRHYMWRSDVSCGNLLLMTKSLPEILWGHLAETLAIPSLAKKPRVL